MVRRCDKGGVGVVRVESEVGFVCVKKKPR